MKIIAIMTLTLQMDNDRQTYVQKRISFSIASSTQMDFENIEKSDLTS